MISRSLRTATLALAVGIAGISASSGSASAKPMFPKGPAKFGMPGKFVKPHWHGHGHGYGWGPGLGLGLAAVGLAGAYATYGDCYVRRIVTIDGEVFYRKVCE
jgi:hypothetical protein